MTAANGIRPFFGKRIDGTRNSAVSRPKRQTLARGSLERNVLIGNLG
jgi:hypothetical protein